jgi:hypothetical protein
MGMEGVFFVVVEKTKEKKKIMEIFLKQIK